ncbi:MAG: hypothetical protein IK117_01505 [Bacteroidales bacterium]|nr:hypothetical protein [Bacteroidales bacterium]
MFQGNDEIFFYLCYVMIKRLFVFIIGIVAFSSVFAQENKNLKVYDISAELYLLGENYVTEGIDTIYWTDCDWDKSLMAFLGIRTDQRIINGQYKTLSDLETHLNNLGYNVVNDIVIERLENNESAWLENDSTYSLIFVKGNSPQYFEKDDFDSTKTYNRNPRGVLLVKNTGFGYKIITQNLDFLDSGEENGGVYFAPELSIGVSQKKLIIDYNHGRYGNWGYEYSFNGTDFIVSNRYSNASSSGIAEDITRLCINFTEKIITYSHIINEDECMENDVDAKYHTIIIPFSTNVIFTMSNRPRYNN